MKKKILILGSQGMLGQMAQIYFTRNKGYTVESFNERYETKNTSEYIAKVNAHCADVVINCIGLIKQRNPNPKDLYDVNARLPGALAAGLKHETLLVHPSTDCIFNGSYTGMYKATQAPDADDDYGISKSMGELAVSLRPKTVLIRASIIGPDIRNDGLGLMAWFMRQPRGSQILGFTNHYWNGITTLQWCELVAPLIEETNKSDRAILIQPGLSEPISKYELLAIMNSVFDRGVEVHPHEANQSINRSLAPGVICPPIEQQLREIAAI